MFSHVVVLVFCFICNICFIQMAILCAWGSRRFKPPSLFGRKMLFLGICSCLLFHKYLNIFSWIINVVCKSIGKVLLRKEVFDSISVFIICTFPFKESILWDNLFIWWVIFSMIFAQFCELANCKFSLNWIPSILIVSYLCFIFICCGKFWDLVSVNWKYCCFFIIVSWSCCCL